MSLFLGIDLGTSYFKVGIFDEQGNLRGLGRVAVDKTSPAPGRFELAVDDFWERLRRGLAEALGQAGVAAGDLAGISYSSQANTFVLLDARDRALTPLVFWTDQRAHPIDAAMAEFGHSAAFREHAGFDGLAAGFAAAKWRWYQKHEPEIWARTRSAMTIADYFTFALTGERCGDASTAAFTGLFDLVRREWWSPALQMFGIEPGLLSQPLLPGARCGSTVRAAGALLGLPEGIPFAVGALDHHVAAMGSGLGRLADMSISTGTVLAALSLVATVKPTAGCYHGPHVDGTRYYRLAFDPNGAGRLEDYQRAFAPEYSIGELLSFAARVPPRADPAGLPSSGVRTDHEHGIAMRHILESITSRHCELVRQVTGGTPVRSIAATGGGARSPLWLQIKADMLGATIVVPASEERACLGAALLASVAVGLYPSHEAASRAMVHAGSVYEPQGVAG